MFDPITLEVLRCKLEAIADDGAKTVVRTAISPPVADAGDCSCAIYDANGGLIVGGGAVLAHFHTGVNGVKAIQAQHGASIADGDVFLVNDPYSGGGFHAQDVFIHIPIFLDKALCAWVGASAHMMDMGGSVLGSFSPSATECYQEALRLPPVRLFRQGEEQTDIWAIFRNNIRMAALVEMDVRALISGCEAIRRQMKALIASHGPVDFAAAIAALADLSEREMRRRIGDLEPGTYKAVSWSEWTKDIFRIPCTVTVEHDRLVFDYRDAAPQSQHYFNSKPYVIQSLLGVTLAALLARDLPFNEGIFRTFEILCRPGSILDAQPPAPIGAPHLDVGQNAVEVAMRAINLAVAASPQSSARENMSGPSSGSGFSLHTLAGIGLHGQPDGWLVLDGASVGSSAGHDRDTPDMFYETVGAGNETEHVDIEVLESWYPIEIERRGPRPGTGGAGAFRAGGGADMRYRVAGTQELSLTIMGNRERVPIAGAAGGLPGSLTRFSLFRSDGSESPLPCHQQGIRLAEGDGVQFACANGGGWGDPLDRDPTRVEADIRHGRLEAAEAFSVYGVVAGDAGATERQRKALLVERLVRAEPPLRPIEWTPELRLLAKTSTPQPLAPDIEQHGQVAVSVRSGAPLARSPHHWTDGCPVIRNFIPLSDEATVVAYLDPSTGYLLQVDVVAEGVERAFETAPLRWTRAAQKRDQIQTMHSAAAE